MNLTNITELCDIQIGRTPKRSEVKYWGNGHSWISIADMGEKYVYDSKEEVTNLAVEECRMKIVPKNTVVMSFKLTIGRLGITEKDLYTNEAIAAFLIKDKNLLLPEYLYYSLKGYNFDHLIDRAAKGKTLNKRKLSEIYIPLIPIDNQKKIIEILNKAENLLVKRQQQIEALSALKQSVFLDMFGDPLINNKKWIISKGDEVLNIKGGYAFKSSDYENDGFPVIRIGNVNSGEFRDEDFKFIPVNIEKYKRFLVKPGDLLISMTGTVGKEDYGNVSMVTNKYDTYLLNQRVGNIDVKNNMNKFFVCYLFKNNHFKRQLTKLSRGVRQANISNKDIYSLDIITPPLNLQKEFENKVKEIDAAISSTRYSLGELNKLYESLLQKAFKGELFKEEIKA